MTCPGCFNEHRPDQPCPSPLKDRPASWPFDPNPRALEPAQNGFIWCDRCDQTQPAAGHDCAVCRFGHRHMSPELAAACAHDGIPDEHLRWRQAEFRAELAESLLCAIAFDDARLVIDIRHGEGCDPGEPDRDCLLCKVQREHVRRR